MLKSLKFGFILFIIASVLGGILGLVHETTKTAIAKQELEQKEGGSNNSLLSKAKELKESKIEIKGNIKGIQEGYDGSNLVGYVIEVETKGFGGLIEMSVGISVEEKIEGIKILKHTETPGLGANAEKPEFSNQFKDKTLDNTIKAVKGESSKENQISAITGATVTSEAVVGGVNKAIKFYNENLKGRAK